MSEELKEDIKKTINLLSLSFENQLCDDAKKIPEDIRKQYEKIIKSRNVVENHFFEINFPYQNMDEGLLRLSGIKNDKTIWLLMNSEFVELQYKNLIKKIEGWACSADKSRTIISSLYNFLEHEKPIIFNYEAEYTFHLPKVIFNDQEKIVNFFEAVMSLYYGDPEKYLVELTKIMKEIKRDGE